jgi:hypothetical protein
MKTRALIDPNGVESLDYGTFLVKGEIEEAEARLRLAELLIAEEGFGLMEAHAFVYGPEMVAREGLFRKQPCICGDGHSYDVMPAGAPGRGVFRARIFAPLFAVYG